MFRFLKSIFIKQIQIAELGTYRFMDNQMFRDVPHAPPQHQPSLYQEALGGWLRAALHIAHIIGSINLMLDVKN